MYVMLSLFGLLGATYAMYTALFFWFLRSQQGGASGIPSVFLLDFYSVVSKVMKIAFMGILEEVNELLERFRPQAFSSAVNF